MGIQSSSLLTCRILINSFFSKLNVFSQCNVSRDGSAIVACFLFGKLEVFYLGHTDTCLVLLCVPTIPLLNKPYGCSSCTSQTPGTSLRDNLSLCLHSEMLVANSSLMYNVSSMQAWEFKDLKHLKRYASHDQPTTSPLSTCSSFHRITIQDCSGLYGGCLATKVHFVSGWCIGK